MLELNKLYLMDCLEGMKEFPDKYFDLAIVDPPYGIGAGGTNFMNGTRKESNFHKDNDWDKAPPHKEYFSELERVSATQIIWGGNYFTNNLSVTKSWIVWDKGTGENSYSDGEMAWTNTGNTLKIFKYYWSGANAKEKDQKDRIHPTQKPVQLYKWILKNYAKPDMKIIDTHVGSGSSIIAFLDYGCEWIGFEIDEDYHKTAIKRIEIHQMQTKLF